MKKAIICLCLCFVVFAMPFSISSLLNGQPIQIIHAAANPTDTDFSTFNITFSGVSGANLFRFDQKHAITTLEQTNNISVDSFTYNASNFMGTTALPEVWQFGKIMMYFPRNTFIYGPTDMFKIKVTVEYELYNAPSFLVPTYDSTYGRESIKAVYEFTVTYNEPTVNLPEFVHWRYVSESNPNQIFSYAYATSYEIDVRRSMPPTWFDPDVVDKFP